MADFFGAGEADMGGFDPFGDANPVNDILSEYHGKDDKDDPMVKKSTLENILKQEEVVQEVRAMNTELIEFLCEKECLETIISYVVEAVPLNEEDPELEIRLFRFPFICTEILCCGNKRITDNLFNDVEAEGSHMRHLLLRFVEDDKPLRPHNAGYWTKLISKLCTIRPAEMTFAVDKVGKDVTYNLACHFDNPCCASAFQQLFTLPFHRCHAGRKHLKLCGHDSSNCTAWKVLLQLLGSDINVYNGKEEGIKLRGWEEFDVSQNNARNLEPKQTTNSESSQSQQNSTRADEADDVDADKHSSSDDEEEREEDSHNAVDASPANDADHQQQRPPDEETTDSEKSERDNASQSNQFGLPRLLHKCKVEHDEDDVESIVSAATNTTVTTLEEERDPDIDGESMFDIEDARRRYHGYIGSRHLLEGLAAEGCFHTIRHFVTKGMASIPAEAKKWNNLQRDHSSGRKDINVDYNLPLASTKRDISLYFRMSAKSETFPVRFVKKALWDRYISCGLVGGALYASSALISTIKGLSTFNHDDLSRKRIEALCCCDIDKESLHEKNTELVKQKGAAPLDVLADILDACSKLGGFQVGSQQPPSEFLTNPPEVIKVVSMDPVIQWLSDCLNVLCTRGSKQPTEKGDYYGSPRLGARGLGLVRVCCSLTNCVSWEVVERGLLESSIISALLNILFYFPMNNLAHQMIVRSFCNIFYKGSPMLLEHVFEHVGLCDIIADYLRSIQTHLAYYANIAHIINLCAGIISSKQRFPEKVKSAIQGSEPWAKIIQSFVSKKVVQRSITIGGPAPEADRLTGMQDSEGEGVRTDAAEDALVG